MNATIGQPIIVNSYGLTVYMYDPDTDASPTVSNANGGLRTAWPYVTWAGALTVGFAAGCRAARRGTPSPTTRARSGLQRSPALHVLQRPRTGDVTGQALNQFFVLDANGNKIP